MARITYVGAWNCSYCKKPGIPGYIYDCPGCGHPRAKNVVFYRPPNAPVATPEQIELMGNDPNWYCASCESGNKDKNDRCWNCGAPRGSDSVQHQRRVYEGGQAPQTEAEAIAAAAIVAPKPDIVYIPPEDPYNPPLFYPPTSTITPLSYNLPIEADSHDSNWRPWLKYGGISAGVLAVILLIFLFFFKTTEHKATVVGFSWTQNVAIEEYQTLHEEGWFIPAGGRQTGSEIRQSGTQKITDGYHNEQVPDTCYKSNYHPKTCYHTIDDGNGGFTDEDYDCSYYTQDPYSCTKTVSVEDYHYEPILETWYFYDIERWVVILNSPTSGTDRNPFFADTQPIGSLQRRIEQNGTYTVSFESDFVDPFERNFDKATWSSFDYDQEHIIVVNAFKVVLEVK